MSWFWNGAWPSRCFGVNFLNSHIEQRLVSHVLLVQGKARLKLLGKRYGTCGCTGDTAVFFAQLQLQL